jgi:hypothetical protein
MDTMLEHTPLPSRHAVRLLIEDLVGRSVDLKDGDPVPAKTTNIYAVYVNNKLATCAVVVVNLELGARIGGALGMLPKGGVDDAIAERDMPEMMRDCCYEVLNVFASVFNVGNAQHVRLYEMYGPTGVVPKDIQQFGAVLGNRVDVRLSIAGYGDGLMSVVVRP